ncbi:DoxX family protein [Phycisphaerales bacterium AB-hyl4]|uniref:DoxX family protein n=1 Tax=Natronomicrosphaera hydrolytica TaxID=3242702 RepID=A0ABV4UA89_9BACT
MHPDLQNRLNDIALLLIRGVLAVVFVFHGSQKLFGWFGGGGLSGTAGFMESIGIPLPMLSTLLAGSAEFFGGIVLLLGVGTRIAAVPMAFTMLVAIVTVHNSAFNAAAGGMEYALTLGVVLVALALTGPGRLTVAKLIPQRSERRTGASIVQSSA